MLNSFIQRANDARNALSNHRDAVAAATVGAAGTLAGQPQSAIQAGAYFVYATGISAGVATTTRFVAERTDLEAIKSAVRAASARASKAASDAMAGVKKRLPSRAGDKPASKAAPKAAAKAAPKKGAGAAVRTAPRRNARRAARG